MTAEILALLTALCFGAAATITRTALNKHGSPFSAPVAFISSAAIVWLIALVNGYQLQADAAVLFTLRGMLDPGLAALFIFVAFRNLGVAVTVPIIAASPIVATALSAVWLQESVTMAITIGTLLVLLGVVLLALQPQPHASQISRKRFKHILLALTGSGLIGIAAVVTKLALNADNKPVEGLAISFTAAIAVQLIVTAVLSKWREVPKSFDSAKLFLASGLIVATGFLLSYLAFAQGKVSVVFPLMSTQPLFALLLSGIFLRKYESITKTVIAGAVLIVAGAATLTAF